MRIVWALLLMLVLPTLCGAEEGEQPAPGDAPPGANDAAWIKARVDSTLARLPADSASAARSVAPPSPGFFRSWSYGLRGSIGGSDFNADLGDSSTSALVGYELGVFASRRIGPVTFEPQLIVAARGANFTDPYYGTFTDGLGNYYTARVADLSGVLQLYYLEAPVLVRVPVGRWFFGPSILGGIVPALLIGGSYSGNRILRDFYSDSYRRTGLGWTLGLGTRWPTRRGALTFDFRYEDGVSEAFKPGRGASGSSQAWMFGCGIELRPAR